jgi:hypothetical protein
MKVGTRVIATRRLLSLLSLNMTRRWAHCTPMRAGSTTADSSSPSARDCHWKASCGTRAPLWKK